MSTSQTSTLISAVAQLAGVLIWPSVLMFFLIRYRHSLADFVGNLGEFTFRAPGVEASGKRQEAAAALGAAVAVRVDGGDTTGAVANPRDVAKALPSPSVQRRLQGAQVLWVDDRPSNNRFERQALEALGIDVDATLTTEDALNKVQRRSYDLIISDMARPGDEHAGYTLLEDLRKSGNQTPYVLYTGTTTPGFRKEARERGAIGATDEPQELVTIVTTDVAATR